MSGVESPGSWLLPMWDQFNLMRFLTVLWTFSGYTLKGNFFFSGRHINARQLFWSHLWRFPGGRGCRNSICNNWSQRVHRFRGCFRYGSCRGFLRYFGLFVPFHFNSYFFTHNLVFRGFLGFLSWGEMRGLWSWPLSSTWCRGKEHLELYIQPSNKSW